MFAAGFSSPEAPLDVENVFATCCHPFCMVTFLHLALQSSLRAMTAGWQIFFWEPKTPLLLLSLSVFLIICLILSSASIQFSLSMFFLIIFILLLLWFYLSLCLFDSTLFCFLSVENESTHAFLLRHHCLTHTETLCCHYRPQAKCFIPHAQVGITK